MYILYFIKYPSISLYVFDILVKSTFSSWKLLAQYNSISIVSGTSVGIIAL